MRKSPTKLAIGSYAGLLGTAAMTLFMELGHVAGWATTLAPTEITANIEARAGVRDDLRGLAFTATWLASHFAYGAAWGAAYTLLRPLLPRSPIAAGLLFGGAVWALGYLGLMPSLRLYPTVRRDDPSRVATMVIAHAVYGVVVSEIIARYRTAARRPAA